MAGVEAIVMRLRVHTRQCLVLVVGGRGVVHEVRSRSATAPVVAIHASKCLFVNQRVLANTGRRLLSSQSHRSRPRVDKVLLLMSRLPLLRQRQTRLQHTTVGGHNMVVQSFSLPGTFGKQRWSGRAKAVRACARRSEAGFFVRLVWIRRQSNAL